MVVPGVAAGVCVGALLEPGHVLTAWDVDNPEVDLDAGSVGCKADTEVDPGTRAAADRGTDPKADAVSKSPLGSMPASPLAVFAASASFWTGFSAATTSFCPKFSVVCSYTD
jgi:hypothetical protein